MTVTRQAIALVCVLVATLAIPLGLRVLSRFSPAADVPPSYLPALEARRARDDAVRHAASSTDLRTLRPEFVLVGDSMAGSRVDAAHLAVLLGYRDVAPIYYAATGPAFWYLALKNWVVASQVRPKLVIIFFRDENLTDAMFRVTGEYRASLDRVARDREPALNDILAMHTEGGWYAVHEALGAVYRHEEVRAWLEPRVTGLPIVLTVRPESRPHLLARMNAEIFGLAGPSRDERGRHGARRRPGRVRLRPQPPALGAARHVRRRAARRPDAGVRPRAAAARTRRTARASRPRCGGT